MGESTAKRLNRRTFMAASLAAGTGIAVAAPQRAEAKAPLTFTILHVNDLHSNFIGMAPSADYTPFSLNDDQTRGGFARLAAKIDERRTAAQKLGPVLVLDAGDYTMGTAFAAATRETGGELRLLAMMGCDATTFGNHDFNLGPDGTAAAIDSARKAGKVPAILATNTDLGATAPTLEGLQRLAAEGQIRKRLVIERGGIRFGLIGVIGHEAAVYAMSAAPVTFSDPIAKARAAVKALRKKEKVDVVIALSHGGVYAGPDGRINRGADVALAAEVPGIDVVVGGHSHTVLEEPIMVKGRVPVVQAGHNGRFLGELTVRIEGGRLTVLSNRVHAIDDAILGDKAVEEVVEGFKARVTEVVFASRGFAIDQPLAKIDQDLPNTSSDLTASTVLANLCTDAFRKATGAHVAMTANGLMRNGLSRGKAGIQTVYDVFAVAPLGAGVLDETPGSALVNGYFTGQELKNILEFCLAGSPARPGDYFPRASGLHFTYDPKRPTFDQVTAIAIGDMDRGYTPIDMSGAEKQIYGVTAPLFFALLIVAIPKFTNGKLKLTAKDSAGKPLASRVAAVAVPIRATPDLLPEAGTAIDARDIAARATGGAALEIKEWQAIMQLLQSMPVTAGDTLPTVPTDGSAREIRFTRLGG